MYFHHLHTLVYELDDDEERRRREDKTHKQTKHSLISICMKPCYHLTHTHTHIYIHPLFYILTDDKESFSRWILKMNIRHEMCDNTAGHQTRLASFSLYLWIICNSLSTSFHKYSTAPSKHTAEYSMCATEEIKTRLSEQTAEAPGEDIK